MQRASVLRHQRGSFLLSFLFLADGSPSSPPRSLTMTWVGSDGARFVFAAFLFSAPPASHQRSQERSSRPLQRRARRHDPGADVSTDSDAARVLLCSGKWEHPAGLTPSWREPATIPRQAGGAASSLVLGPRSRYNTFTLCSFGNFAFESSTHNPIPFKSASLKGSESETLPPACAALFPAGTRRRIFPWTQTGTLWLAYLCTRPPPPSRLGTTEARAHVIFGTARTHLRVSAVPGPLHLFARGSRPKRFLSYAYVGRTPPTRTQGITRGARLRWC